MTRDSHRPAIKWASLLTSLVIVAGLVAHGSAVTIPTVTVGSAGNSPDQLWPTNNPTNLRFGAVSYDYRIGTTEVTNAQYAEFLNEKAKSDPYALYTAGMTSNVRGGITRGGVSGSFSYNVKANMGDKPVNFVSWYDALRFANWLHNGQGTGDTETGAYTILGGTATPSNGLTITRNANAQWFLPSEDEWYKGAYYQPATQGGDTDNYWLYATASNLAPTIATANTVGDIGNPGVKVANYNSGAIWNSTTGNVTTVGSAGPLSNSFYGTADQGGNVREWNEALVDSSNRSLRGGWFATSSFVLESSFRGFDNAGFEGDLVGFRVASVPEPGTAALGIAAFCLMLTLRKRFK